MQGTLRCITEERLGRGWASAVAEALAQFDLRSIVRVRLLKHEDNAVFSVRTSEAQYMLRLTFATHWGTAPLEWELRWLQALRSPTQLRVPEPVPTRAGALFAQVRYNGPADTLWRLIGIETIDLSGPVGEGECEKVVAAFLGLYLFAGNDERRGNDLVLMRGRILNVEVLHGWSRNQKQAITDDPFRP